MNKGCVVKLIKDIRNVWIKDGGEDHCLGREESRRPGREGGEVYESVVVVGGSEVGERCGPGVSLLTVS